MNKNLTTSVVASLLLATSSNLYSQDFSGITVSSATKSEQSIKDVTSNIEVITKEEIEERHFTTVLEALNTLNGVSFKSHGNIGSSTSFYLRGMDNLRTLVLIDGVRFQDPSNTAGANFSHLMITDIERIELIKGAQSGIWGSEAAAGVINIITKKAGTGVNGTLNLEAGSFNTKKANSTISYGTKDYDVKFSVNKIKTDGFTSVLAYGDNINDFEKDGYTNTTLSLDTNYYVSDSTKLNLKIKDIDALVEYDKRNTPNNEDMKSDVDTRLYSFNVVNSLDNHKLTLKYQLSKFNRHEIGTTASPGFTWGGIFYPGSENVLKFNGETNNLELSDEISYWKNDFVLLGMGLNKDDVDYIMTDNSSNEKTSKSKFAYITNSNKFDKTVLTQSIRFDEYKNFDNKLTGKIGIKQVINKSLELSSNIGTGYNVPSIIKEFNPWGLSNDDLQPEETTSFDIGFKYNSFSFTYFRSKVDNLIDWDTGGYKNIEGESNFKGVELSYKKLLFNDYLLTLNYTHLHAKDSDKENLLRRPKRKLNFALDYYGIKDIHVNINGEYIGKRMDDSNTETGNYVVWNSVINYKINQKLSTYIKLDNVFDKYYQTSLGYATAPRSAYIGLNYKF